MFTINNENKKYFNVLIFILVLIPVFIFIRYAYVYAINIPRQDDYDAILVFITVFKNADLPYKLQLLFLQQNEHRILSSRIIYALYYYIFDCINFRHIIFINGAILISIFSILFYFIKKAIPKHWPSAVAVLSMCLFDLNNFENMDFAMGGMQNFGIVLLVIGSIFFYGLKGKGYIIPAVIFQIICVYSSGNGGVGAFFIMLFTILNRDKFKMYFSITTFIITAPLYYYHYQQPGSNFFTLDPTKFIPFFVHVAGAHFSYLYGIGAGILTLVLFLTNLPFGKKMSIKPNTLPLLCLSGFILSSMAIMSVFRGNLPLWCSFASRYFIYSHLLVTLTFVFILIKLNDKKIIVPVIILSLGLILLFYKWNAEDGRSAFKSFRTNLKTIDFDYPDKVRAKKITDDACKENIYCIDKHRAD